MAIRLDYKDFPFESKDRGIWYFVIDWDKKTKKEFSNLQEKRDIVPFLRAIISNNLQINNELMGVWNGKYKTDIFIIPIEEGYSKLKEHFPEPQ